MPLGRTEYRAPKMMQHLKVLVTSATHVAARLAATAEAATGPSPAEPAQTLALPLTFPTTR